MLLISFTSFKTFHQFEDFSNRKEWIPEDFNPRNVTLLIAKHPSNEKYNRGMTKFIEEEYPWKFEVVSTEDLKDNTKFPDKKTYQFAILWTDAASPQTRNNYTYHDLEGHFLDRSIDKEYPKSGYGLNRGLTAYKKILTVLVKKFKDGKDVD